VKRSQSSKGGPKKSSHHRDITSKREIQAAGPRPQTRASPGQRQAEGRNRTTATQSKEGGMRRTSLSPAVVKAGRRKPQPKKSAARPNLQKNQRCNRWRSLMWGGRPLRRLRKSKGAQSRRKEPPSPKKYYAIRRKNHLVTTRFTGHRTASSPK